MKMRPQKVTSRRMFILNSTALGEPLEAAKHWLELRGRKVIIGIDQDLALKIHRRDGNSSGKRQRSANPKLSFALTRLQTEQEGR